MSEQATVDPVLRALVQRFADSQCSWLSSVRPDGRAHSAPVWHVWFLGRAYVITTAAAVKVINIQAHSAVVIAHPDPVDPVIIEGLARVVPDSLALLGPLFKTKYDWDPATSPEYGTVVEITPTKLMAWGKYGEGRWSGADVSQIGLD